MKSALDRIADWLKERNPGRRRALQKRRMEAALRTHGMSRSQARRIVMETFR
jgi:hypothetical protein